MAVRDSFDTIEQHLRETQFTRALPLLLRRYGVNVDVQRNVISVTAPQAPNVEEVYKTLGIYSNRSPDTTAEHPDDTDPGPNAAFPARILISHATFTVAADPFAGDFNDDYIYTEATLRPGDRFTITRGDNIKKSWKIVEPNSLGLTQTVFKRFKITSIVD